MSIQDENKSATTGNRICKGFFLNFIQEPIWMQVVYLAKATTRNEVHHKDNWSINFLAMSTIHDITGCILLAKN